MKKSANNGRRPQTATEKKKLMVGLDGHWLTFPFPFVHHQPLHIFYLSSSFLFHVYLQRKRKINIRRNKKEERRVGEVGRRLMHLVPAPAVRLMKRRVQSRPGVRQLETIPGKLHPNTGLESKISDSGNRKIDFGIACLCSSTTSLSFSFVFL